MILKHLLTTYLCKQKSDPTGQNQRNCGILESSDTVVTKIPLFGDSILSVSSDTLILISTMN